MPITLVLLAKNGAVIRNIVVAPTHGIVPIPGDAIYTGEGTLKATVLSRSIHYMHDGAIAIEINTDR